MTKTLSTLCSASGAFTIGSIVKRDRTAAIKPVNRRDEKLKKLERESEAKRKRVVLRESIWLSVKDIPYIAFKKLVRNTFQANFSQR